MFDRESLLAESYRIRAGIEAMSAFVPDELALENKSLCPVWSPNVVVYDGTDGEHPQTKMRGPTSGLLYKCNQPHTTQADWPPETTPAIWVVIDVTHAGTQDDPVPAARGMEYIYGLHYTDPEDGKLYRCERTGEESGGKITLQYLPHEVIGQYFVEVVAV